MDELIRELEEAATEADKMFNMLPAASRDKAAYSGMAQAYRNSARLAQAARRRMADRELELGLDLMGGTNQ